MHEAPKATIDDVYVRLGNVVRLLERIAEQQHSQHEALMKALDDIGGELYHRGT